MFKCLNDVLIVLDTMRGESSLTLCGEDAEGVEDFTKISRAEEKAGLLSLTPRFQLMPDWPPESSGQGSCGGQLGGVQIMSEHLWWPPHHFQCCLF